jgi:hypothetical protein
MHDAYIAWDFNYMKYKFTREEDGVIADYYAKRVEK